MFLNQGLKCCEEFIGYCQKSINEMGDYEYPSIQDFLNAKKENEDRITFFKGMRERILNSINFYLGNYSTWSSNIKKMLDENESPFYKQGFKLPYPICSFSYSLLDDYDVLATVIEAIVHGTSAFEVTYCVKRKGEEWFPLAMSHLFLLEKTSEEIFDSKTIEEMGDISLVKNPKKATLLVKHATLAAEEQKFSLQWHQIMKNGVFVISMALKFLRCRNASTQYIYTTKQEKFNKIPKERRELFRYKVLKVMVPKNRKVYVYSNTQPKMSVMPVHLTLGHEKEYTEERPLFGKWVGKWWWQDFLRGDPKNGFITKGYCVKSK